MLGPLLSALAVGQMRASFRRARHRAMLSAVAGLLLAVGAVFLFAAGFLALLTVLPAVWVCVIFGAVFVIAGLIVLLFRRTERRPRPANAALYGAIGGGATAAAIDDDDPAPARAPRRSGWIPDDLAGKAAIALPLVAFAAALYAGRRSR